MFIRRSTGANRAHSLAPCEGLGMYPNLAIFSHSRQTDQANTKSIGEAQVPENRDQGVRLNGSVKKTKHCRVHS